MQILPVLDLLNGVVVRGVAGQRESYRPIVSRLCDSAEPLVVAGALRDAFGLTRFYLADLDAILHSRPNLDVWQCLATAGFLLMIDGGFRDLDSMNDAYHAGAAAVVAGLETIPGPRLLSSAISQFGPDRVVFSLDLQAGRPLGDHTAWGTSDPLKIAGMAMDAGVTRLIVLDLASVGVSEGPGATKLCGELRSRFPHAEMITGGGIRDIHDLKRLAELGVDGALVATALHHGSLSRRGLESIAAGRRPAH